MRRNLTIPSLLQLITIAALLQRGGIGAQSVSNTVAADGGEKKITAVLEKMVREHQTYLSVPVQDGKALRSLTESAAAKNVVEIGTSTGYSGLWLCLALGKTNGHLTTGHRSMIWLHRPARLSGCHFNPSSILSRMRFTLSIASAMAYSRAGDALSPIS